MVLLTGGAATTLAALDQQFRNYDIKAIDSYRMHRSTIEALYDQLNKLSLEQRTALPGMESGRADIILPALIILLTLLNHLDINTVQISIRGACYGILL
jgi:exopolyphosphatase/guanosine-5'-triphosphate,3'-diphosphate pyrophosphatase